MCGQDPMLPPPFFFFFLNIDFFSYKQHFATFYVSLYDIYQGFQSGPVPGTFTRLRSCIVPAEITEPPKISGGQNHKYDGR